MFVAYTLYIAIWGHVSISSTNWLNYAVPDYEISIAL